MKDAILVTGARGLVGRAVAKLLVARGHPTRALVRSGEQRSEVERVTGAAAVVGNVLDRRSLEAALAGTTLVVSCAGLMDGGAPDRMWAVNADGVESLARAMLELRVERLIHMSSLRVFGLAPRADCSEDEPHAHVGDPYGDSKIEGERRLAELPLRVQMVRPGTVFGDGDRRFVPELIGALRANRVRLAGDGANRIDPIHADDVAATVVALIAHPEARAVNVASSEPVSAFRLVTAIAQAAGIDFASRSLSRAAVERLRASWGTVTELPSVVLDILALDRRVDLTRMHGLLGRPTRPFAPAIASVCAP